MYKRLIAVLVAAFVALAGLVGPASAGETDTRKATLTILDSTHVDKGGDLDVDFEIENSTKDEAVVFGVAKFYAKYACVKRVGPKWKKKFKVVAVERDWGKAYDKTHLDLTEGTGDDEGYFSGTGELELELDLDCTHPRAKAVPLFVKWSHLFVKDWKSGAKDFDYGPWYRSFYHHGGHHGGHYGSH